MSKIVYPFKFLLSRKGKFSASLALAGLAFYLDPLVHTEQHKYRFHASGFIRRNFCKNTFFTGTVWAFINHIFVVNSTLLKTIISYYKKKKKAMTPI